MAAAAHVPEWVTKEILPQLEGPPRAVHPLTPRKVLVLGLKHAIVAEKPMLRGLKMYRIDYPTGFLVNGADCPHCGHRVVEPIGKVATLASPAPVAPPAEATKRKGKR